MSNSSYTTRRGEIETYFDRTAVEAWARLTSTAPVGRIRATVRAGRDEMRKTLLSYLPADLRGARVLDAGCGTGALALEAAKRGANVTAIDLSPTLVKLAAERMPADLGQGSIDFRFGDMLDPSLGTFDYVVGMDSLIHYCARDVVASLERLAARTRGSILFTFAPKTLLLTAFWNVGRLFPRGDRAPAIEPQGVVAISREINAADAFQNWKIGRSHRVATGFYTSQAMELVRK